MAGLELLHGQTSIQFVTSNGMLRKSYFRNAKFWHRNKHSHMDTDYSLAV